MHESTIHCTQLFVYLRRTKVLCGVNSYYSSNLHSTVCLNRRLHVCILVSRNVLHSLKWNFLSVSSNSKHGSHVNLVSFHSFVAAYEFRETYFWGDPPKCIFCGEHDTTDHKSQPSFWHLLETINLVRKPLSRKTHLKFFNGVWVCNVWKRVLLCCRMSLTGQSKSCHWVTTASHSTHTFTGIEIIRDIAWFSSLCNFTVYACFILGNKWFRD